MPVETTITTQLGDDREADDAASPRPQLIVSLQCARPLAAGSRHLLDGMDLVILGRGDAGVLRERQEVPRRLTVRLPDERMSREHARLFRRNGRWAVDDANSKNGTVVNGARVQGAHDLVDGDLIEAGRSFFVYREAPVLQPEPDLPAEDTALADGLATFSPALWRAAQSLSRVAALDIPVLVRGETGTGKEVVARAVHALSRRPGAFVAVNCGALPSSLREAELFGFRKGTFSGANEDRPGLVRSAHQGTLFLDEIGELGAETQVTFLRVLQEREVVPIGETRPIKVDLRLVTATHRALEAQVAREHFRQDLFARISGLTVTLPPLRDRREDLAILVAALLRRLPSPERITFRPAAARALFGYGWPLNVRELERCLATAAALAGDAPIDVAHLPEAVRATPISPLAAPAPEDEDVQLRRRLVALLVEHDGNISAVARAMGKGRMQIHRWARRLGVELEGYKR